MARFRTLVTSALTPLSILAPIGLVLSAGLIPPARDEPGPVTILGSTVIIAAVLLLALLALVGLFRAKWLRTGTRELTAREAGVVTLLTFLLVWWCLGLSAVAHGPGTWDGFGALAYIHGMFGTLICLGVLYASAVRRTNA